MADRTIRAIITGSSAGAVSAFEETALAADEATGTIGDKFDSVGGHISGLFGKLGQLTQNIPIVGSLFSDLSEHLSDTDGAGKNLSGAMSDLGKISLVAGAAAFAGVAVESTKLATAFQTTVTSIASNAHIPVTAAQSIGNAFLDTAGKSMFSGQEIGAAYAAVAGQLGATQGSALSAAQALTVMKASSDLAEASGESLGSATSSLANVMQAFKIPTSGAADASDTLYNASRLTGQSVDSLSSTFDKVHSKLGDLSPSLSGMSALLVDMTNNGVTGRAAVTALNSAFTGLAEPTAAVTAAQQAMGVSFVNAKTGALDPMSQIISELGPKIDSMGDAQATATLKTLGFGSGSAALVSVIKAGPAAFDAASASVNKTGTAADAARLKSGTLHDQMETLKSTVDDLATKFGQVLIPILEKLGGALSDVIGWLLQHKVAMIAVAAVIGGVVVTAIGMFVASLFAAEGALAFIIGPVGLVIAAVAALAAAAYLIVNHWGTIVSFFTGIWNTIYGTVFGPMVNFFTSTIPNAVADVVNWIRSHWELLLAIFLAPIAPVIAAFVLFHNQIIGFVSDLVNGIVNFFTGLPDQIVGGLGDIVSTIWAPLSAAATWVDTNVITPVVGFFTALPQRIVGGLGDILSTIWAGFTTAATWVDTNVIIPVVSYFTALPGNIVTGLGAIVTTIWGGLTAAATWVYNNVVEPVLTYFTNLPTRIVTALGNVVGTIWGGLTAAATWVDTNVITPVLTYFTNLPGRIVTALGNIVGTIFGGLGSVATWMDTNVGTPIINFFTAIPGRIKSAAVGMWDGISDAFKSAINTVIGWWDDLHFHIPGFSVGPVHFGGFDLGMPTIPMLAAGGIVPASPGGTLAILGEGGSDEAVIPLSNRSSAGAGGGDTYDFSGMTVVANDPQTLVNQLKQYIRRNGSLASAGIR